MATYRVTGGTLEVEPVGDGGPPGIWGPTDPRPTPPIYIQVPPGVIDGKPEHPIWLPVYPAHPIVLPPGFIDGVHPEHPIVLPPYKPEHPIYLPPGIIGGGKPEHPIYLPPVIWPDPGFPHPEHPIVIPDPPTEPPPPGWSWGYTARFGWVAVPPGGGGKPQPIP